MLILTKGEYYGASSSITPVDGVLIGLTRYQGGTKISPMHAHENPHLSFVLHGTMGVRRKDIYCSEQKLESFSFMRAGEMHQNTVYSDYCKNINLEFEPDFFAKYDLEPSAISPDAFTSEPGSALLMIRLYRELLHKDENFSDSIHMLLLDATANWKRSNEQLIPPWMNTVSELLRDKWNDPVSLQDLSRAAGVHSVTISKYFARFFGCSLGAYRRKLKIERAIQMIVSTDMPLTDITFICGFFDQSHFIRVFKAHAGLLPKQLRSQR